MPRKPKMSAEEAEALVMKTARAQFSQNGYYATKMSDIAGESGINKREVYEFITNKDTLYMTILSEVSREMLADMDNQFKGASIQNAADAYAQAMIILCSHKYFTRLLTWEWLGETLQGVRILNEFNTIMERLHSYVLKHFPDTAPCIRQLDMTLEAMIARFGIADSPSALPIELILSQAKHIFECILRYKESQNP